VHVAQQSLADEDFCEQSQATAGSLVLKISDLQSQAAAGSLET
jgi:hypothetical protein